ncbi:MAG: DNRLRE domain-containing protein [Planctomycetota bacterium]|nr:DNRLRE domain-containing protein [Planctomycetota bacterium]
MAPSGFRFTCRFLLLAALVAVVLVAPGVRGETVTLEALKDTSLYESADGLLANGSGPGLFVGRTAQIVGPLRRALVAFDIATAVPPGATIQNATFTLTVDRAPPLAEVTRMRLHRVTRDWGEGMSNAGEFGGIGVPPAEGDASWIHTFFPAQNWSTPGGDFVAEPSAGADVAPEGPSQWQSEALVADVQSWLDDPAGNFGWVVVGDEVNDLSARRFASRELEDSTLHPTLTVEFVGAQRVPTTTGPGAALLALAVLAVGGLLSRQRRAAEA